VSQYRAGSSSYADNAAKTVSSEVIRFHALGYSNECLCCRGVDRFHRWAISYLLFIPDTPVSKTVRAPRPNQPRSSILVRETSQACFVANSDHPAQVKKSSWSLVSGSTFLN